MKQLNVFNDIVTIISFIMSSTFLLSILIRIYTYFSTKKYIKGVLGFNRGIIKMSHSTFWLDTNTGINNRFITYASLKSINNIINLLNIVEQKFTLMDEGSDIKNEINIGGFLTNKRVNAYFAKYFPSFEFVTKEKYESVYNEYSIDRRIIKYSSNKYGFKIGDEFLETNSKLTDYAFLIKLIPSDFKNDENRTVHILFGGTDIGTIKATEYLLTHYKQIYKKYKKQHYLFAIKINQIDESIDYSEGIIDLTDIVFKK